MDPSKKQSSPSRNWKNKESSPSTKSADNCAAPPANHLLPRMTNNVDLIPLPTETLSLWACFAMIRRYTWIHSQTTTQPLPLPNYASDTSGKAPRWCTTTTVHMLPVPVTLSLTVHGTSILQRSISNIIIELNSRTTQQSGDKMDNTFVGRQDEWEFRRETGWIIPSYSNINLKVRIMSPIRTIGFSILPVTKIAPQAIRLHELSTGNCGYS